jgi:hypothetical protein
VTQTQEATKFYRIKVRPNPIVGVNDNPFLWEVGLYSDPENTGEALYEEPVCRGTAITHQYAIEQARAAVTRHRDNPPYEEDIDA